MDKAQFWRLIEDAKAKSGGDCEEIGYAVMDAYQEVRGQELELSDPTHYPSEPVGVKWSDDEELDTRLPRIRAKVPLIDEDEKLDRP